MRKYEEKLHLDKSYEKIQSSNKPKIILGFIQGIIGYVFLYAILKYILNFIPDLKPWNNFDTWFTFHSIQLSKIDFFYFIFGIISFCYGSIHLFEISSQNHNARDKEKKTPKVLLQDGFYSKLRHPMYGTFIILQSSIFLSLRSLIGVILASIVFCFQYYNACREEKNELIPLFKNDYLKYIISTPRMLLKRWEVLVFEAMILFNILGLALINY